MMSMGEFRAIPEGTRATLEIETEFARVPGFVLLHAPAQAPERAARLRTALLKMDDSAAGKSFMIRPCSEVLHSAARRPVLVVSVVLPSVALPRIAARVLPFLAGTVLLAAAAYSHAQPYPNRPVKLPHRQTWSPNSM